MARPLGHLLPRLSQLERAAAGSALRRRRSRWVHAARRDRRLPGALPGGVRAPRPGGRRRPLDRVGRRRIPRSTTCVEISRLGRWSSPTVRFSVLIDRRARRGCRRTSSRSTWMATTTRARCRPGGSWWWAAANRAARSPRSWSTRVATSCSSCGRAAWMPRRIGGRDIMRWLIDAGFLGAPVESLPSPAARLLAMPTATGHGGGHDLDLRILRAKGVVAGRPFPGRVGSRGPVRRRPGGEHGLGGRAQPGADGPDPPTAAEQGIAGRRHREPGPFDPVAPERLSLDGIRRGPLRRRIPPRLPRVAAVAGGVRRIRLPDPEGWREQRRGWPLLPGRALPAEALVVAALRGGRGRGRRCQDDHRTARGDLRSRSRVPSTQWSAPARIPFPDAGRTGEAGRAPRRGDRPRLMRRVRAHAGRHIAGRARQPARHGQIGGGDDGTRTRVNGFADRSLATRARRHAQLALAAPRGFEPRFTDPKSAVLPARRRGICATLSRLAGHRCEGRKMERKTGLEPATLTLAR